MKEGKNVFIALLRREAVYGYKKSVIKYIGVSLLFIIINLIWINKLKFMGISSISELFYEIYKGISYDVDMKNFTLPTTWLLINSLIIFIIGNYVQIDFKQNGTYLITRCGKKRFWMSKVVWALGNVLVYYLIIFSITIILSNLLLEQSTGVDLIGNYDIVVFAIILYVTTSSMLVILYMTMTFIIKPKYSYCAIITMLLLSIFIKSNFMPGQHSLILRHLPYDEVYNLTLIKSVVYNIIVSTVSLIIGMRVVENKDIL